MPSVRTRTENKVGSKCPAQEAMRETQSAGSHAALYGRTELSAS